MMTRAKFERMMAGGKRGFIDCSDWVGKKMFMSMKKSFYVDKETGEVKIYIPELEYYPWADTSYPVPIKILEDHPNYIHVRVLPHVNDTAGNQLSQPYEHSISKIYIERGFIKIKEAM